MSRILITATPVLGHVNPMLMLGAYLTKRGHTVVFHTGDLFRERAEAAGMQFVALLGSANFDYRRVEEIFPDRITAEPGLPQLSYDMKHAFGDRIPDQYRGVKEIISQHGIEVVVTDNLFLGNFPLLLGAMEPRPLVIGCGILPYWLRRRAVSPLTGPDSTAEGMLRNAEHNRLLEEALAGATEHVNAILRSCGAQGSTGFILDATCTLFDAFVQFTVEEFEYEVDDRPANLHFVGPMIPPAAGNEEVPEWLAKIDGSKPVVFVTQGTVANFDFDQVVKPAIAALAEEDVEVIVTAGGGNVADIPLSPKVHVERYLPYHLILPKVDVLITNGGYNGVQQALSFGVPVIAAGGTEDKPFVAARVAAFGVGIDLKTGTPTPDQIRDAVRQILSDRSYWERAEEMQRNFARCDALDATAVIIESVIAEGERSETAKSEQGELVAFE